MQLSFQRGQFVLVHSAMRETTGSITFLLNACHRGIIFYFWPWNELFRSKRWATVGRTLTALWFPRSHPRRVWQGLFHWHLLCLEKGRDNELDLKFQCYFNKLTSFKTGSLFVCIQSDVPRDNYVVSNTNLTQLSWVHGQMTVKKPVTVDDGTCGSPVR